MKEDPNRNVSFYNILTYNPLDNGAKKKRSAPKRFKFLKTLCHVTQKILRNLKAHPIRHKKHYKLTKVLTRYFISFSLHDLIRFMMRPFFRPVLPVPVCTLTYPTLLK